MSVSNSASDHSTGAARFTKSNDQLIGLGLPPRLVLLYGKLVYHAGADGKCNPNHSTLAREIRILPRQVRNLLGQLQFFRLIRWKRGRYSNEYQVLPPDIAFLQRQMRQKSHISDDPDRQSSAYLSSGPDRQSIAAQIGNPLPVPYKEEKNLEKKKNPPTPPKGKLSPSQQTLPGICASDDARAGGSALAKIPQRAQHPEWFAAWWAIYWRKVSRKAAEKAFRAHVRTQERFAQVMGATRAQTPVMKAREPDKRPHGATWLNAERWDDEVETPARKPPEQASLVERTKALWAKRIAKGESPL